MTTSELRPEPPGRSNRECDMHRPRKVVQCVHYGDRWIEVWPPDEDDRSQMRVADVAEGVLYVIPDCGQEGMEARLKALADRFLVERGSLQEWRREALVREVTFTERGFQRA